MSERIRKILEQFQNKKIIVIGDVMLDRYVWGKVKRLNPEAPVTLVDVYDETFSPGGAANVAANIGALCGSAVLFGVVGKDNEKSPCPTYAIKEHLEEALRGYNLVTAQLFTDNDRITTVKTRIMAWGQQLLRVDRESCKQIASGLEEVILDGVSTVQGAHAIIVSDYAKGVITQCLYNRIVGLASQKNLPLIVDPKPKSGINYSGATVLKLNHKEACEFAGIAETNGDGQVEKIGKNLVNRFNCGIIITRAEKGVSVFDKSGQMVERPSNSVTGVVDVSGAGDTFMAALALALVSNATLEEAAEIANTAAGKKLGKVGAVPVSFYELAAAYADSKPAGNRSADKYSDGKPAENRSNA